jgi:glucose-6-phosphate-specific signal transduction histidine kinase
MNDAISPPSERTFGLFFAAIFAGAAAWTWYADKPVLAGVLLAGSIVLLPIALLAPRWLSGPNKAWFKLGLLLNRVVSPLVLLIIYLVLIVPAALALRLIGRDALKRRYDAKADSYWIDRSPPGPPPGSFNNQF